MSLVNPLPLRRSEDSIEEQSTTPVPTVADVNDLLPEKGKDIATVQKFNTAWVRAALAALDIAVGDKSDLGECKAALSTYYMNLNAAKPKVGEVGGSAANSTTKGDSFFLAIRARGVLLKKAPSLQRPREFTGRRT